MVSLGLYHYVLTCQTCIGGLFQLSYGLTTATDLHPNSILGFCNLPRKLFLTRQLQSSNALVIENEFCSRLAVHSFRRIVDGDPADRLAQRCIVSSTISRPVLELQSSIINNRYRRLSHELFAVGNSMVLSSTRDSVTFNGC